MEKQYKFANPQKKTKNKYHCMCDYYGKFNIINNKPQCPKCNYIFDSTFK